MNHKTKLVLPLSIIALLAFAFFMRNSDQYGVVCSLMLLPLMAASFPTVAGEGIKKRVARTFAVAALCFAVIVVVRAYSAKTRLGIEVNPRATSRAG